LAKNLIKTKTVLARTTCPKTPAWRLGTACASRLLPLLLLLALTAAVQAQFTFTTNNGAITIIKYTGSGGAVTIPDTTNGWPVTSIGYEAFNACYSLTNAIIGNSVTSIGNYAFEICTSLTNVIIGNSVTSIGNYAFYDCTSLTSVTIPNSVTSIGTNAFYFCGSLTSVTIGNSVTNIGDLAFNSCAKLTGVYFQGPPPSLGSSVFYVYGGSKATVYYLPGTTGWANFAQLTGLPVVLWNPRAQSDASFGVLTNRFGFNIIGSSNLVIVVEACTNFTNPVWQPVQTNTLNIFIGTNGTSYFSDPQWTNYLGRFYRLRSP